MEISYIPSERNVHRHRAYFGTQAAGRSSQQQHTHTQTKNKIISNWRLCRIRWLQYPFAIAIPFPEQKQTIVYCINATSETKLCIVANQYLFSSVRCLAKPRNHIQMYRMCWTMVQLTTTYYDNSRSVSIHRNVSCRLQMYVWKSSFGWSTFSTKLKSISLDGLGGFL